MQELCRCGGGLKRRVGEADRLRRQRANNRGVHIADGPAYSPGDESNCVDCGTCFRAAAAVMDGSDSVAGTHNHHSLPKRSWGGGEDVVVSVCQSRRLDAVRCTLDAWPRHRVTLRRAEKSRCATILLRRRTNVQTLNVEVAKGRVQEVNGFQAVNVRLYKPLSIVRRKRGFGERMPQTSAGNAYGTSYLNVEFRFRRSIFSVPSQQPGPGPGFESNRIPVPSHRSSRQATSDLAPTEPLTLATGFSEAASDGP